MKTRIKLLCFLLNLILDWTYWLISVKHNRNVHKYIIADFVVTEQKYSDEGRHYSKPKPYSTLKNLHGKKKHMHASVVNILQPLLHTHKSWICTIQSPLVLFFMDCDVHVASRGICLVFHSPRNPEDTGSIDLN